MKAFDLGHYLAVKKTITKELKILYKKWNSTQGIFIDGIIDPGKYKKQKTKFLTIVSETYGYDRCGVTDIVVRAPEDNMALNSTTVKTTRKIATLLWLLEKDSNQNSKVLWGDFPDLFSWSEENNRMLMSAIAKTAWVNVKKVSGPRSKQNADAVYHHAIQNKNILEMQIEACRPDLILVCGDPAIRGLLDIGILGSNIRHEKEGVQVNEKGQKIVLLSHPSYPRDWSYEKVYKYYSTVRKHL